MVNTITDHRKEALRNLVISSGLLQKNTYLGAMLTKPLYTQQYTSEVDCLWGSTEWDNSWAFDWHQSYTPPSPAPRFSNDDNDSI